ncbi:MAG: glycosyl hydrolase, partial [Tardiphaga sp.]|nr:glycosyl hydrolase [Tardiphaga sp.]
MSDIGSGWFSRKRAMASRSAKMPTPPTPRPRRSGIMLLEPRMMYDAAGAATVAAATQTTHDTAADPAAAAAADKSTAAVTSNSGADTHTTTDSKTTASNVQTGSDNKTSSLDASNTSTPAAGASPSEIVFIDKQAPDYQMLADGVKAGVTAVILDSDRDGLTQIADYLTAHPSSNLTTIDIVAHGQDGMLFLGNGVLDNATVGQYAAQLKTIGAALKSGGDLMLYGCDIAENPDGLILMQRIVEATGADVAGSTGPVGDAARGGSWSLNVTAGAITSAAPFTAETLSQYHGLLNAQLFGIETNSNVGLNSGIVFGTDNNGSGVGGATGVGSTAISAFAGLHPQGIQLDVADGLYFVLTVSDGTHGSSILQGSLSQALSGGTQTFTTVYSDASTANTVNSFQVDVADNMIFFNHVTNFALSSHSDQFQAVTFSGAHFSGSHGVATLSTTAAMQGRFLAGMVVDTVNHAAYFYEISSSTNAIGPHGGISTGTHGQQHFANVVTEDRLYKASWNGSNVNPTGFTLTQLPIALQGNSSTIVGANQFPTSLGAIAGLALDTTNQILYFDTNNVDTSISTNSSGIYSYHLTGNATGAFGMVWTKTASVPGGLSNLIIDPQTNKYYVSVGNGSTPNQNAIYEGSLSGGGAPGIFITVNPTGTAASEVSFGLALDEAPILTVTGSGTPAYTEQGTAVFPLAGSLHVGASDSDTTTLSGATITLGSSA